MSNRNTQTIFSVFLASLLCFVGTSRAEETRSKDLIKLGAIVSLTGDASENGKNWMEGAQLAIDELRQSGQQVELIVEDDRTIPGSVASAFIKLSTQDKVDGIIGGTWDFLAETAYPLAKQYKVPFITPTNPVEILSVSAQSNPWIFTNGLSLKAEQHAIESFLAQKKAQNISLVYINVPYGTSHAELLRKTAQEKGLKIVSDNEITYQGFHDGIKVAALKIKEAKPDFVFVVLNYEGVDFLLREFEKANLQPTVLMPHTLKEAYDFGASPSRYTNAYGIYSKFTGADFEAAFKKKYGRPAYDYAAAGYDAVKFMAELVKTKPTGSDGNKILVYDGVTGRHELPSADRSVVKSEASIMKMDGVELVAIPMQ
ncbi:MAG: amino acid ABC transporter substrate-binding protein [Deltaproteobacteria bacterium]|nr:amino acid ABC transporter substrate-binding protein [Deltaproteobacteria bacterium]